MSLRNIQKIENFLYFFMPVLVKKKKRINYVWISNISIKL